MRAGASAHEITPDTPQYLWGYPHADRMSEGVHDPLYSSALYLEQDEVPVLMIANDLLFVSTEIVRRVRQELSEATGIPAGHILISATHTHSAPKIQDSLHVKRDPAIPPVDSDYVNRLVRTMIESGREAVRRAVPAELGFAKADSTGIGTNRHDPSGPSDHEVPVIAARSLKDASWIGMMYICSMHPTVLHEDSKQVSADFPGAARRFLHEHVTGPDCPVLHHMGCAGNQSPRHVTRANTFEEADRLGRHLGQSLVQACGDMVFASTMELGAQVRHVDPPRRTLPSVEQAEQELASARQRYEAIRSAGPSAEARTAECDVFGAEQRLNLAGLARQGILDDVYAACTPTELQVLRIGDCCFAAWPSEWYVEFGLAVKQACPGTYVITVANGYMPGYITTPEAVDARRYESGTALFTPEAGNLFIQHTTEMMREYRGKRV